jgi:ankyrin repeat protein
MTTLTCDPCNSICLTCTGSLTNQCTACTNFSGVSYLLTGTTCATTCNSTAYNNTALFFAMGFKYFDIVKYLIQRGANIHHINIDGENILFGAVHHNNIELVKLLCMKGINKDVCNKQGHYPIFSAIANQNYEIVKILIEYGASIEVKEKIFEDTPLLASMKSKEIAELLINSGANIHAENKIKDTPIHIAVLLNNLSIVKKLAEKGANLNKMNKQSNNPIIFAVGNGYIDIVKYLFDNRFSANKNLVKERALEIAEILLQLEIQSKFENLVAPEIIEAIQSGQYDISQYILKKYI